MRRRGSRTRKQGTLFALRQQREVASLGLRKRHSRGVVTFEDLVAEKRASPCEALLFKDDLIVDLVQLARSVGVFSQGVSSTRSPSLRHGSTRSSPSPQSIALPACRLRSNLHRPRNIFTFQVLGALRRPGVEIAIAQNAIGMWSRNFR